jgi:hypothetical protein
LGWLKLLFGKAVGLNAFSGCSFKVHKMD